MKGETQNTWINGGVSFQDAACSLPPAASCIVCAVQVSDPASFTIAKRLASIQNSNFDWLSAKLRDVASVAGRGRLLLSVSVAHASLKTVVVLLSQ